MSSIQALRGTRDILPEEVGYWQQVEAIARQILNRAAYQEIRPPMFEQTSLFERGIGEATDVVGEGNVHLPGQRGAFRYLAPEGTGWSSAGLYRTGVFTLKAASSAFGT
jgi:histidyl-tRNA synthetase